MQRPWVAMDASREGEVRLALAHPGATRRLQAITAYSTDALPTFTDALIRFQAEAGIELHRMDGALAIADAVAGHAIPIARSKWTISRTGLAALFCRPPIIVNDVAARAWSLRDGRTRAHGLHGLGTPDLAQPGRFVLVTVNEGVGSATIDIGHDGVVRILESEGGHLDFAAVTAAQTRLAAALASGEMAASWEQVLMLDRNNGDLVAATPALLHAQRSRLLAGLLGRFAANMVLSPAAWSGVLLTGAGITRLLGSDENAAAFDAAFQQRRTSRRIVAATPCRLVEPADPVLNGLAALVAERPSPGNAGQGIGREHGGSDHRSIRMRVGSSIAFLSATRKVTASRPSISRWS